jgi:hypothetical protein
LRLVLQTAIEAKGLRQPENRRDLWQKISQTYRRGRLLAARAAKARDFVAPKVPAPLPLVLI